MMTVVTRGRHARRYLERARTDLDVPPTWLPTLMRYLAPEHAPGSAKPGRGGRRKRRRRVQRWSPAEAALRSILATTGRRWFVLPQGATLHLLEARPLLGRRERRRRAKLRRRRTRALTRKVRRKLMAKIHAALSAAPSRPIRLVQISGQIKI